MLVEQTLDKLNAMKLFGSTRTPAAPRITNWPTAFFSPA